MPAYRPDFYVVQNIIGCSGDIRWPDLATVYFESPTEYGRITQNYPRDKRNEGRSTVKRKSPQPGVQYVSGNREVEFDQGNNNTVTEYCFYECLVRVSGGGVQVLWEHVSRSVVYTALSAEDRDALAECITNFPELKPVYQE